MEYAASAAGLNLPPYVIFQDPSLEAMATTYPINSDELANIVGVGVGKAKRYGDEFIKVIRTYVEDNEIERPEDLRVRTVANKSKLKISIIHIMDSSSGASSEKSVSSTILNDTGWSRNLRPLAVSRRMP